MTKRATMANAIIAFMLALTVLFLAGGGVAFAAGEEGQGSTGEASSANTDATAVSDESTIWDWEDLLEKTTQNIGRIWTDKSVTTTKFEKTIGEKTVSIEKAEDSDFLTALTALSSTSNLSSTISTPLDIVMVLDMSSSMNEEIDKTTKTTKLAALKDAASSFVDTIEKQNEVIEDSEKQHRVALVSFNTYASTNKDMTTCAGTDAEAIKDSINALTISQGTRSDLGLQEAQSVLTKSKRNGAKQIVVFFTDGTPTTSRSFMPSIASPAVTYAKEMKTGGAAVYTIGVLDGANPGADPTATETSNENKFLHAVSSNYPNATYTGSGSSTASYTWSFGERAKKSDGKDATFYKSAATAEELKEIFKDISDEITESAGYPTETDEGAASTSGWITFEDQLGEYMQVDDFSAIVYNGETFTKPEKTHNESDNTDTYTFTQSVTNENSETKSLSAIQIIVKHYTGDDVDQGDKITVQIPASLIPLRHFKVDLTNGQMTVDETTPISVFYNSSLKSGVEGWIANPSSDPSGYMSTYIDNNTDEDGKVNFYANDWSGQTTNLGTTKAWFTPSKLNKYYYFTQDTPIYTDEACTQQATTVEENGTYYYKHDFYTDEDGKPVASSDTHSFKGEAALHFDGAIGTDDDGVFINAGTPRLLYLNELHKEKVVNTTGTATDVLNPRWEGGASVAGTTIVDSFLGNNGKLTLEKPATLEVKKTLADDYSQAQYSDKKFSFMLRISDAAGKGYQAQVFNADGTKAGDSFTLAFNNQGIATANHALKHGQTLKVYGLSDAATYSVSEIDLPSGFTQTEPAEGASVTGTLKAGETATASFTNTYKAETKEPVSISANKDLAGRDLEKDEFSFGVKYAKDYAAGTGDDLLTATNDANGNISFGEFSYDTDKLAKLVEDGYATKDGNVWNVNYFAYEKNTDDLSDKGITPTVSWVSFTVKVTNNGDGTLSAAMDSPEKITFKNQYNAEEAKLSLNGLKNLKYDEGLTPESIEGKYTFKLSSDDKNAPMPEKTEVTNGASGAVSFGEITFTLDNLNRALGKVSSDDEVDTASINDDEANDADAEENAADNKATKVEEGESESGTEDSGSDQAAENDNVSKGDSSDTNNNADAQNSNSVFDVASANADEVVPKTGKVRSYTFVYKVTESGTVAGVTNDKESTKLVRIKVTDDGEGHLTAQFVDEDDKTISEQPAFTFTNTYSVEPTKSSVTESVEVTKKLTGRDLAKGEFSFELLDADGNTVATGTNDADGKVKLGSIEYTKPGEYGYTLHEIDGGKTIDNVVYDSATYAVVVKVTDNGDGTLKAQSQIGDGLDGLTFTNTYVEPTPEPTPDDDSDDPADDSSDDEESADTEEAASTSAKTGDNAAGVAVAVVAVALAAGACFFAARRRQN